MLNGYCVCGFCLSMLAAIGGFYAYVNRFLSLDPLTAYWFGMFHHAVPILGVLGLVFCLIGRIECRKHEQFGGAGFALAGALLAAVALIHFCITTAVFGVG